MINSGPHTDVCSCPRPGECCTRVTALKMEVAYWKGLYDRETQTSPIISQAEADRPCWYNRGFNRSSVAIVMPETGQFSALCDDIVGRIHDFVPSSNVSITSRGTRELLPKRHTRTASDIVESFRSGGHAQNIVIRPHTAGILFDILFKLAPVMETLRSIEIDLQLANRAELNIYTCGDIAQLRNCPNLHTLNLKLSYTGVGNMQAIQLSHLGEAPSLTTLHLELCSNLIMFTGIEALVARLRRSPLLRTLYLDLDRNPLDDHCLSRLSTLMDAPSQINTLVLNLGKPPPGIPRMPLDGTLFHPPNPNYRILDTLTQNPGMVSPSLVTWGESSHERDPGSASGNLGRLSRIWASFVDKGVWPRFVDRFVEARFVEALETELEEGYWWTATGLPEVGKREFWEPGAGNIEFNRKFNGD
jgi:hypothetical protein